jgi:hypothetical protein
MYPASKRALIEGALSKGFKKLAPIHSLAEHFWLLR